MPVLGWRNGAKNAKRKWKLQLHQRGLEEEIYSITGAISPVQRIFLFSFPHFKLLAQKLRAHHSSRSTFHSVAEAVLEWDFLESLNSSEWLFAELWEWPPCFETMRHFPLEVRVLTRNLSARHFACLLARPGEIFLGKSEVNWTCCFGRAILWVSRKEETVFALEEKTNFSPSFVHPSLKILCYTLDLVWTGRFFWGGQLSGSISKYR